MRYNIGLSDEEQIIATIKEAMPAVVSVVISRHLADVEKELPTDIYPLVPSSTQAKRGPKKVVIPEQLVDSHGMVQVGGGSGFIVDSSGLILTNKHVLSDPKSEYTVVLNDGRKFPAEIISRDPINDVAILKIEADKLPTLTLGDATQLELGRSVLAIGNALGLFRNTVSVGIVSGLSRAIVAQADPKAPPQELRGLIQTDAAINPGNSGGPLITLDGLVIGINAAIISGAQSISFAIPISAAERDLSDLKKFGRICRPYLGVRYIVIDDNYAEKLRLPISYGALVTRESPHDAAVVIGGPCDKAGVRERDVILRIDGTQVTRDHTVQDILEDLAVGDEIELTILRGDEEFTTKTVLTERR